MATERKNTTSLRKSITIEGAVKYDPSILSKAAVNNGVLETKPDTFTSSDRLIAAHSDCV